MHRFRGATLPLMMAAALMVMACQISAPEAVAEIGQEATIEPDPGAGQDDGTPVEPGNGPDPPPPPPGGSGPGTSAVPPAPALAIEPAALNVLEGSSASYTVALAAQPAGPVAVTAAATSQEITLRPSELRFGITDWRVPQPVAVDAAQDHDAAADAQARITHSASGGGYDGVSAMLEVTIVEDDVATLAIVPARASEQGGSMRFAVTLSLPAHDAATIEYATRAAGDSATEDVDYSGTSGTLRFPPGSTAAQAVEVTVLDDLVDEPEEQFTVTLSNPSHAVLAGGGATATATGTIEDDDQRGVQVVPTLLTVPAGGSAIYTVALTSQPTAPVTVAVEVPAGAAVSTVMGVLSFGAADWRTAQTVTVSAAADASAGTTTIVHRIGGGDYAELPAPAVTVTIPEPLAALELSALEVTGGGTMHPPFDGGVRHYGVRCSDGVTLAVAAESLRSGAQLTLLRDNPDDNVTSTGNLGAQVEVENEHDIAIELSDDGETALYVVHCIPQGAPKARILTRTAGATGGLLFANIGTRATIVDYNGVIRHRLTAGGRNFRFHADGPVIDGRRVAYTVVRDSGTTLMDAAFDQIRIVLAPASFPTNTHDFVLGDDGFLFISYVPATRNYQEQWGEDLPLSVEVEDSVIVEVPFDGSDPYVWNSWDHLKIVPDCEVLRFTGEYAHLNSLQLVDGDVIASFRGCAQVVRLDRSSGSWALQWKLGGSDPPRHAAVTEYLEIVGDPRGEFCGQHHATQFTPDPQDPDKQHIVLFDNGVHCLGPRKTHALVTRVVEYDVSSDTHASFVREYSRSDELGGYAFAQGGVEVLENGNWLISWGNSRADVPAANVAVISEVDPAGNAVFHMNIRSQGNPVHSYRVYHADEDSVTLPLNLP